MAAEIYVSISDNHGRLIVDGSLLLLAEFLLAMRRGLVDTPAHPSLLAGLVPLPADPAQPEPAGESPNAA